MFNIQQNKIIHWLVNLNFSLRQLFIFLGTTISGIRNNLGEGFIISLTNLTTSYIKIPLILFLPHFAIPLIYVFL